MTDLRLVPKPEGFELRDKRGDKTNSGEMWSARDALYSASVDMPEDAEAVTVVWRQKKPEGGYQYHRRNSGPNGATLDLIVTALGVEMGWTR